MSDCFSWPVAGIGRGVFFCWEQLEYLCRVLIVMETPSFSSQPSSAVSSPVRTVPSPWYALRTFNCQELKVGSFLEEKGKEYFIPMTYVERHSRDGKSRRVLVPVVHNMVFVRKDESQKAMLRLFGECMVPLYIIRKEGTEDCYEIPDTQMTEFRALCDPGFDGTVFMTGEEAEARPGKPVRVVHGPFTGMTGKLHRIKNNFYFIKTLVGVGVMLRISRWYCQPIAE